MNVYVFFTENSWHSVNVHRLFMEFCYIHQNLTWRQVNVHGVFSESCSLHMRRTASMKIHMTFIGFLRAFTAHACWVRTLAGADSIDTPNVLVHKGWSFRIFWKPCMDITVYFMHRAWRTSATSLPQGKPELSAKPYRKSAQPVSYSGAAFTIFSCKSNGVGGMRPFTGSMNCSPGWTYWQSLQL